MTEPSRPASFYDARWTDAWGDLQDRGPFHRHHRRIVSRMLAPLSYASVLDVGCGAGQHLAVACRGRAAIRSVGVDLSPMALERAAARRPGEYRVMDVERQALGESFDLVMCFQVLEHLADDATAVRHLAAMSRRWVLVSTMQGLMAPHEAELGHVRRYTRAGLGSLLRSAGLEPVRTVEWGWPFYSLFESVQSLVPRTRAHVAGRFGPGFSALAVALHALYFLNSSRGGPLLIILAERRA